MIYREKFIYISKKEFSGGTMGDEYWKEIVLPSVKLPDKATYNFGEVTRILDCSKMTLWRKIKKGEINYTIDKRFYREDLVRRFSNCSVKNIAPDKKE
jgi:hypothetical protein